MPDVVAPRIVRREEHSVSRRDIDPDALKVLYRLRQYDHVAYLVGGSVRDLLLGRRPKDFDVGTSAHPYQVKKLFRNCWIIGRRFRLAHVKFGMKVIEVATFRRQVVAGEEVVADGVPAPDPTTPEGEQLIHHDNTFGTPEEDAFRRDFTINALFYDIATFSVIDYVGGLEDLRAGIVRSIGDPDVRLNEDPVRMLRAIAIAARLDFTIEPSLLDGDPHAPPRNLEELDGAAARGVLQDPARRFVGEGVPRPRRRRAARADFDGAARRRERPAVAVAGRARRLPPTVRLDAGDADQRDPAGQSADPAGDLAPPAASACRAAGDGGWDGVGTETAPSPLRPASRPPRHPPNPRLGDLPLARRDIERLRQIISLQRRLKDVS
jgi:poly(A) polymerase